MAEVDTSLPTKVTTPTTIKEKKTVIALDFINEIISLKKSRHTPTAAMVIEISIFITILSFRQIHFYILPHKQPVAGVKIKLVLL